MSIAIETLGIGVVEAQIAVQRVTVFHSGHVECGMATDREQQFAAVGVLHVPDHVDGVAVEPVGHAQIEVEGIDLECLFALGEGKGDAVVGFGYESEVALAGKSVAQHVILLAVEMIGVVPESTDDGEEGGRVLGPVFRVGLPQILVSLRVAYALHLCTTLGDGDRENVVA